MDTNKKHEHLTKYTKTLVQCKARQLVGKAGFTQDDIEDLEQDLTRHLLACLPQFDPAKAKLNTFADRVVGSRMVDLLRRRSAETRNRGREAFSLNQMIVSGNGSVEIIETVSQDEIELRTGRYNRPAAERAHLAMDLNAVLGSLSPELRQVAAMLQSQSVAEVARELGIPRRTFREKHLAQLREVFTNNRLDDYLG